MPGLVYLFLGRENALKGEALEELKKQTLSGGDADLNSSVFYSDQFDPQGFQDAVNTQPFLSPKRFVIIKNADRLPKEAKEPVAEYAKNGFESTVLVITADMSPKEAEGDPFMSGLSRYAKVRNFSSPEGAELRRYISERASLYGKQISDDSIGLLTGKIGNDIGYVRMAVEKLANYTGDRKVIEKRDVENLVGRSLEESVFQMTDAMCAGNKSRALLLLSGLLRDSTKPESVIGAIGAALKRKARAMGRSPRAIAWLKECFAFLSKADRDVKTRDLDKKVILESLVVRLSDLSDLG
ncbi:MAG TPA: DNA polymerase III subunit delta [Candidatus Omnitrophota bacterium]|nr:DNA polymerase III subunit delta [Candidatus Omnitrophota bacterium]HOX09850.1 DNA polymerase III subunit delta [Candidatus Omnitrophota bacterium]HPN65902.1 DNA polymerase III subunit delta [Candidatus Omnitrophota bacterium]HRZ67287.1 DNA polymerase III subunit delta [Candidatus Omnitrophota bacterium]